MYNKLVIEIFTFAVACLISPLVSCAPALAGRCSELGAKYNALSQEMHRYGIAAMGLAQQAERAHQCSAELMKILQKEISGTAKMAAMESEVGSCVDREQRNFVTQGTSPSAALILQKNSLDECKRWGSKRPTQDGLCGVMTGIIYENKGDGTKVMCITASNNCVYRITFRVRVSSPAFPMSDEVEPSKNGKICATFESQSIEYLGWRKWGAGGKWNR